ncbi:MAG: transglutaminase domain-containing protein [Clostridiales bacterium]|nr:transglutaminase domain-containing protein [Clostridiales bacterium]
MLKRSILLGLVLIMVIASASIAFADINVNVLNQTGVEKGFFTVNVTTQNEIRVLVNKDDQNAVYTLNETANLPLQMGNGVYSIRVYEKLNGRFQLVKQENITLNLENQNLVYLNSVQNINWNSEMNAIKIAAQLTNNLETEMDKITAIHKYLIENISYDYIKARTVKGGYLPAIDSTLESGNGICYDYSSVLAAMLRSVNIPTKVSVGHVGAVYHAWNEVYLSETDEWITIDATTDAIYNKYGIKYELEKTSIMYNVEITY